MVPAVCASSVQSLRKRLFRVPPLSFHPCDAGSTPGARNRAGAIAEPASQGGASSRVLGDQVQEFEPGVEGQGGELAKDTDFECSDGPDGHRRIGAGQVSTACLAGGERRARPIRQRLDVTAGRKRGERGGGEGFETGTGRT